MRLIKHLPKKQYYTLSFDNWFSTFPLLLKLKNFGIITCATIRSNRIANCSLDTDKELKKSGCGSSSYRVDANSGIIITKWFDNKSVHIVSNNGTAGISSQVQRWDGKAKKHIMVDRPDIVKQYNSAMGGVYLADMLISLYRTPYKTRRRYFRVVVHLLDICKVNAWLLYRRYADQMEIPSRRQMNLSEFSSKIAHALLRRDKLVDRPIGRPLKRVSEERLEKRGKRHKTPAPQNDIRFDEVGHWAQKELKKGKCRNCKMTCRFKCIKCSSYHGIENGSVYLCFEQDEFFLRVSLSFTISSIIRNNLCVFITVDYVFSATYLHPGKLGTIMLALKIVFSLIVLLPLA